MRNDKNLELKESHAQQTKQRITKQAFANLLFVSIAEKLAYFFNPFIDSAITGIFLDSSVQAAIGFFVPIITIISLVWVVIMGVQILCAQYRGRGDSKSMRALFDSAILLLSMAAIVISVGFFFGRAGLAAILGAQGQNALVLQDYIAGYSFSIIGQALYPLLLWFLNFNGNDKISKTSLAIMVVLNFCFDMLFAVYFNMSAFGLGLATSLSYLLTCAYVFREFLINYGWGQTTFATIRWSELKEAVKIGKPSITFNLGAYNLKEEYRTQHKDAWLVDGMPLFENVTMALLSAAAMPLIGSDAVWLSFPATELICIAIIACTVFKNAGKVTFKLDDWLKINDDFGKMPTLERAFHSMEDVVEVSSDVVNFCRNNRLDENLSSIAGVVTEELSGNVLLHGVKSSEHCSSYIRATFNRHLYIRIYDDNNEFNPRKEMQKIESEPARSGEEKIGLRLVKSITDRYGAFDYQNTAGINTSIVELRC